MRTELFIFIKYSNICDFQVFQHFRQSKFQALQNAQNQQCEKVNNVVFLKTHKVGSGHTHLLSPNHHSDFSVQAAQFRIFCYDMEKRITSPSQFQEVVISYMVLLINLINQIK